MSLFFLLIKKFAVSMLSPCIFVFRFFFSFFFAVHWLNRVQKGNLNIHPITCLRTGSWSGLASGSGSLPVSLSLFFLLFGIILPFAYFSLYFSYFWNFRFPPNYLSTRWFSLDPKALAKTGVIGRANPLAGPDHFRRFTWYRPDPSLHPRQCFDFETLTNFPLDICHTVCLAGSLSSKIILKSPRSTASCLKALTLNSFSFLFTVPFKAATFAVANHQVWRFPILHRVSASKISFLAQFLKEFPTAPCSSGERWAKFTRRIWSCPLQWSPVNHACVMRKDFLIAGSRTVHLR